MRKLFVNLGMGFAICAFSAVVFAQDTFPPEPQLSNPVPEAGFRAASEEPAKSDYVESLRENLTPRISKSRQLITLRAMQRARERASRIEARKRMGLSLQRPLIQRGHHAIDLNRFQAYPWLGRF